jgi:hypothetical protein
MAATAGVYGALGATAATTGAGAREEAMAGTEAA